VFYSNKSGGDFYEIFMRTFSISVSIFYALFA